MVCSVPCNCMDTMPHFADLSLHPKALTTNVSGGTNPRKTLGNTMLPTLQTEEVVITWRNVLGMHQVPLCIPGRYASRPTCSSSTTKACDRLTPITDYIKSPHLPEAWKPNITLNQHSTDYPYDHISDHSNSPPHCQVFVYAIHNHIIENLYFIVLSLIIGSHWFTWINKEDLHCFRLRKNWLFICYGYGLICESRYCAYMSRSNTLWS